MSAQLIVPLVMGVCGALTVWWGTLWREEEQARGYFRARRPGKVNYPWLKSAAAWRRFKEFPDFLELLALGLSSGFTLDRAWEEALRFLPRGPLREELQRTANDFSLGRARSEALEDLMRRLNDDRLSGAVVLLGHGLKYGTPLEAILLEEARRLRGAVMMALERRAQTAGIRLLFPLVFFILPTLFIVLFGPLFLGFLENGKLF